MNKNGNLPKNKEFSKVHIKVFPDEKHKINSINYYNVSIFLK